MKNINLLLSCICIIAMLISCSSETDSPVNTSDEDYASYFPLAVDNWWVSESWETDASFNKKTMISRDSLVVVAVDNKSGKDCFKCLSHVEDEEGLNITNEWFYMQCPKIYVYSTGDEFIPNYVIENKNSSYLDGI